VEHYVLIDRLVRAVEPEVHEAFWQSEDPGRVGLDLIGDVEVSTVFLPRPAGRDAKGAPLLFETALFGPSGHIGVLRRYATWGDALRGHQAVVEELRRARAN
jgi:hypothetical protein